VAADAPSTGGGGERKPHKRRKGKTLLSWTEGRKSEKKRNRDIPSYIERLTVQSVYEVFLGLDCVTKVGNR